MKPVKQYCLIVSYIVLTKRGNEMVFNRYTVDVSLGSLVSIFHISERNLCLSVLLGYLGVEKGSGGGSIRLEEPRDSEGGCVPSDLLYVSVKKTELNPNGLRVVDMIDSDFENTKSFGICTKEKALIKSAEEIAQFDLEVDYSTSHMIDQI